MIELISGKEALIALANGEEVECRAYEKNWINANNRHHTLSLFFDVSFQFRLKPRTVNLNGVEVGQPESSDWDGRDPNDVVLKFKSKEDALHFHNNILKIFNGI